VLEAISLTQTITGISKTSIFAHSFGACVLASQLHHLQVRSLNKLILLAPALNQKALMRYRFVQRKIKEKNSKKVITRATYTDFLKEKEFLKDCKLPNRITKYATLHSTFYEELQHSDFSTAFMPYQQQTLHLHGTEDTVVPLESISSTFIHQILIE
jgi:alpha-beta hydrolase superfamily lysophospholipase